MKISTDNGILRNTFGDLEALRMIRQAGFDGVDMTFYDMVPEQDILALPDLERRSLAKKMKALADDIGLFFPQSHAPYLYGYGESKESKHYMDVVKSFEMAAELGCKQMVIHSLKFPRANYTVDVNAINLDYFRSFLPLANEFDVNIGIENLFNYDSLRGCYFGQHGTPDEINRFVDELNDPRFVCCCDVGHCALTGCEPEDFIGGMSADRLTMLHVQDLDYRDDRHWLPYMGMLNWDSITTSLAQIGFVGTMNFEVLHYYDKFPPKLMPQALVLAAQTARHLADLVEEKNKLRCK